MKRFKYITVLLSSCLAAALQAGPTGPTALTATAVSFSSTVLLQWSGASDSGGTLSAYEFFINAATAPAMTVPAALNSAILTVPCGTTQTVLVRALDNLGLLSPASVSNTATVSLPCQPVSPIGVTVSASQVLFTYASPASAYPWASVSYADDTASAGANSAFQIFQTDGSFIPESFALTPFQSVWIRVFASDSAATTVTSLADLAVMPPPAQVSIFATASSVNLSWLSLSSPNAPGIASYNIYNNTGGASPLTVTDPGAGQMVSVTFSALTTNTTYQFQISSSGGGFEGSKSAAVSVLTQYKSPAITHFQQYQGGPLLLSWTDSSGAVLGGYEIFRSTSPGLAPASLIAVSGSTSATLSAPVGQSYYYVAVTDSSGLSSASPPSTSTAGSFVALPAMTSTALAFDNIQGTVNLSWVSVTGATEYRLYHATSPAPPAAQTLSMSASTTNYSDLAPVPGKLNYYWVSAAYVSGTSYLEGPLGAPLDGTPILEPVTSLAATPLSFTSTVSLTWTAAQSDIYPVGAYNIYVNNALALQVYGHSTHATLPVICGQLNSLDIVTVSDDGSYSVPSAQVFATCPCAPALAAPANPTPTGVTFKFATPASALALGNIRYELAGVSGLAQGDPGLLVLTPSASSFVTTSIALTSGQSYWIRGLATDLSGTSVASQDFGVMPQTSITAISSTYNSVYLQWGSVSSAQVSGVTGYLVYYDTNPGVNENSPHTVVPELSQPSFGSPLSLTLSTGLSPGVTYYFGVAAEGGGFVGGMGLTSSATLQVPVPTITHMAQSAGGQVEMDWAPVNLSPTSLVSYLLYRSACASLTCTPFLVGGTSSTSLVFNPDPAPSIAYYYVAVTGMAAPATYVSSPVPASGVELDNFGSISASASASNSRVLLNWQAPASPLTVSGYFVYRSTAYSSLASGTVLAIVTSTARSTVLGTSFLDISPVSSTNNYYYVTAFKSSTLAGVDGAGFVEGSTGTAATGLPLIPPGEPGEFFDTTGVNSTNGAPGMQNFMLTMTAVPNAVTGVVDVTLQWSPALTGSLPVSFYQLFRGSDLNNLSSVTILATVAGEALYTYKDLSLDASLPYVYSVTATDSGGNSGVPLVSTLGPYPYPLAPSSLSASISGNTVTLNWISPTTSVLATSYLIYRSTTTAFLGTPLTVTPPISAESYVDVVPFGITGALKYTVFSRDTNGFYSQPPAVAYAVSAGSSFGAPSQVTGVVVQPYMGNKVLVSWNPNPSNEGDTYNISATSGANFVALPGVNGTSSPLVLSGINYGALVAVSVLAQNASGLVSALPGLPQPPLFTNVLPTPVNLSACVSSDSSASTSPGVLLSWSDLGVDGVHLTGYEVYRNLISITATSSANWISSATPLGFVSVPGYRDTNIVDPQPPLPPNPTTYYYAVASLGDGQRGALSNQVAITPTLLPQAPPTGVSAIALTAGASVLLSWNSLNGISHIWIFKDTSSAGGYPYAVSAVASNVPGDSDSYVATGIQPGLAYTYAVAGANAMGLGPDMTSTAVAALPPPPASFTATPVFQSPSAGIQVSWTEPSGYADTYVIWRDLVPSFNSPAALTIATLSASSFTDLSVTPGTPYYYEAVAYIGGTTTGLASAASTLASAVPILPPQVPKGFRLQGLPGGSVNVDWATPSPQYGNVQYVLNYSVSDTSGAFLANSISLPAPATSYVITTNTANLPVVVNAYLVASNSLSASFGSASTLTRTAVSNATVGLPMPVSFTAFSGQVAPYPNFQSVQLSWTAASGYGNAIYMSTSPIKEYQAKGGPASPLYLTTLGGTNSYSVSPLAKATAYYFAITTYNSSVGFGSSGESLAALSLPRSVIPYSFPVSVSVTTAQVGSNRVDLSWDPPAFMGSSGGLDVLPYRLYRYSNNSSPSFGTTAPDLGFPVALSLTSYADLTAVNGFSGGYTYLITIVDSNHLEGPPEVAALSLVPTLPRQPPQLFSYSPGDGVVTIQWLVAQEEGGPPPVGNGVRYNVYRRLSGTANYGAPELSNVGPIATQFGASVTQVVESLTDTAQDLSTYYYTLAAINSTGEGERSPESPPITPFKPLSASDTQVFATVTNSSQVLLTWFGANSNVGLGGYGVKDYLAIRSPDSGVTHIVLTETAQLSFIDTKTHLGGTYLYNIVPVDLMGNTGNAYQWAAVNIPAAVNNVLVFRNAFNPNRGETVPIQYSVTASGHVKVSIFTIQGEYVATLFDETASTNGTSDNAYLSALKYWNGHTGDATSGGNASGPMVASGVYIIHVEGPGFSTNARVAVIK